MRLELKVNGQSRSLGEGATVLSLLGEMGADPSAVAVEVNLEVVRRADFAATHLHAGDEVEVVRFVGGGSGQVDEDAWSFGSWRFSSRLMVGTGKYQDYETMAEAIAASGTQVVTVAVRRLDPSEPKGQGLLDFIDRKAVTLLPNTAGAKTADEAVRIARLAREAGMSELVKLEVIGDDETLLPDGQATLEATRTLVKEGFTVLPYTTQDPILAQRLEDAGAATIMPYGSPIGSGQGIPDLRHIELILRRVSVPVVVDAGLGVPSDAALAMEMGAAAVLVNSAIARAARPVAMARAFSLSVKAGRLGYLAGRIPKKEFAIASSPEQGRVGKAP